MNEDLNALQRKRFKKALILGLLFCVPSWILLFWALSYLN